jgi:Fe-S-cluster containining protein
MKRASSRRSVATILIDGWRIAPRLLAARVAGRGPCADCDGSCCRHGAYVALAERDRILAHARGIRRMMDDSQPHDPAAWFARGHHRDDDFPGGVAVGTRVHGRKCVFRTRDGLCAIQRHEERAALPVGERLKPFYCRLFPLTTDGRRVDWDPLVVGARPCCTPAPKGETPAVVAWRDELRMLLGEGGLRRLGRALRARSRQTRGKARI